MYLKQKYSQRNSKYSKKNNSKINKPKINKVKNKKIKKSLKNLFSKLSYSQTSDSHKFQINQNLNYSNLKTTGSNRKFVPKEAV